MLNDAQITEVEGVFLAIDSKKINDDLAFAFIDHFYDINLEQRIYLLWLLNRWVLLRKEKNHLPKRFSR